MKNSQAVLVTIHKVRRLLRKYQFKDWDQTFERLTDAWCSDPEQGKSAIRRLFGGMGSFNDLVLQHDGSMPQEDNDEMDQLRRKIFTLCE